MEVEKVEEIILNVPDFDVNRAIAHIRKALAGEEKTIAEYIHFADEVNEWFPILARVFREIADEEKVHVGELRAMLARFENDSAYMKQGAEEVAEIETKFADAVVLAKIEQMLADENENYTDKRELYRSIIEKLIKE